MIRFDVPDMTCGHCAKVITSAIRGVDPKAEVAVDLASCEVNVSAGQAEAASLRAAIEAAGYTPVQKVA